MTLACPTSLYNFGSKKNVLVIPGISPNALATGISPKTARAFLEW